MVIFYKSQLVAEISFDRWTAQQYELLGARVTSRYLCYRPNTTCYSFSSRVNRSNPSGSDIGESASSPSPSPVVPP